jgi:hypothetical protein
MEPGNGAKEAAGTDHARTPSRRTQGGEKEVFQDSEYRRDEEKAESQECGEGLINKSARKIST